MPDHAAPFNETDAHDDPTEQFRAWFSDAREAMREPEAMAIATSTPDGHPSVRMVLCKSFDEHGFTFFTNTQSRKGRELGESPRAMLLFYWEPLGRQVRIEGGVEPVSRDEALAYAQSRARGSQISALISDQSRVVDSRRTLEQRVAEAERRFDAAEVPLKDDWGGYRLVPEAFEFWQNRRDRLHDRLRYSRLETGWLRERLQP